MEYHEKSELWILWVLGSMAWSNLSLIYWLYPIVHAWALLACIPMLLGIGCVIYLARKKRYRCLDEGLLVNEELIPYKHITSITPVASEVEIATITTTLRAAPQYLELFVAELLDKYQKSKLAAH